MAERQLQKSALSDNRRHISQFSLCRRWKGEAVLKPRTGWSIFQVSFHPHEPPETCAYSQNHTAAWVVDVDYPAATLASAPDVDADSWFMTADTGGGRFTTWFGWTVSEIYTNTFVHISASLSYLLMPSTQPLRLAVIDDATGDSVTVWWFTLRVQIITDYLV